MPNDREDCCGRCANFVRLRPDDLTAPEGKCQLSEWPGSWPMNYWPAMLSADYCINGYTEAAPRAD